MLDKNVMSSLLSEVPSEVFDAISPLSNKNSQAIFIALIKKDQMRFGELKDLFNVKHSEDINSPLKSLLKAGLISKKAEFVEDIGDNEIAVYCPSYMGKSVMRSLYRSVMIGDDHITRSQIPKIGTMDLTYLSNDFKPNIPDRKKQINPNSVEHEMRLLAAGGR